LGYRVEDFVTIDPALASAVAWELDRVDPLPCPHGGPWFDVTGLSDARPVEVCGNCGHRREPA
jgi:hypothetical protein